MRIASFNAENLFARFRFTSGIDPAEAVRDGWTANENAFDIYNDVEKRITAKAVRELHADVVAFQEVENLDTLRRFRGTYLDGRRAFPYALAIDGNDPRFIDVAVLSRYPIVHARSWADLRADDGHLVFSRDCLEVDVAGPGGTFTLFVNHLKSMIGGRAATRDRRLEQAAAVREIVCGRFGPDPSGAPFVVLGDFNDYPESDESGQTGIADLATWNAVENVVQRLPESEQWTHFFNTHKEYRQLDYVLPSASMAQRVTSVEVMRKGLPLRADLYTGERFADVGYDRPKASDHCPVVVTLDW